MQTQLLNTEAEVSGEILCWQSNVFNKSHFFHCFQGGCCNRTCPPSSVQSCITTSRSVRCRRGALSSTGSTSLIQLIGWGMYSMIKRSNYIGIRFISLLSRFLNSFNDIFKFHEFQKNKNDFSFCPFIFSASVLILVNKIPELRIATATQQSIILKNKQIKRSNHTNKHMNKPSQRRLHRISPSSSSKRHVTTNPPRLCRLNRTN